MATMQSRTSSAAQRAQKMRDVWQRAHAPVSRGFGSVFDYFLAYPAVPQGVYYILTGLWPWLALGASQETSREISEHWSVLTLGLLTIVIGLSLCVAGFRREGTGAIFCLALGTPVVLVVAEGFFVGKRYLPATYLLDAIVEVALAALWVYSWGTGRNRMDRSAPLATVYQTPESYPMPSAPQSAAGYLVPPVYPQPGVMPPNNQIAGPPASGV